MSVALRDFFAAHVAAALVNRADTPASIARRAFDVADALCAERQYREELDWLSTPPESVRAPVDDVGMVRLSDVPATEKTIEPQLLDEPAPLEEETEPFAPSARPDELAAASLQDLEEEELSALAAAVASERAEILALVETAGYVPAWDPSWDDRADMTDWDREARWERAAGDPPPRRQSDRPGLARTVPEQMELRLGEDVEKRRTGSS